MDYIEVENDLIECLNFKSTNTLKANENKKKFLNAVNVLKYEFGVTISTKYLMGFVVDSDKKQQSNRVNYLLKSVGLNDRVKTSYCFLESTPTTTAKECEVFIYSLKDKNEPAQKGNINLKVLPMTSTDHNGIKRPCKVGITARRLKTVTLHQIPL